MSLQTGGIITTGGMQVLGRLFQSQRGTPSRGSSFAKGEPYGGNKCEPSREPGDIITSDESGLIGARFVARTGGIKANAALKGNTLASLPLKQGAVAVCGSGITGLTWQFQPQWYVEWVAVYLQCRRYENLGTLVDPEFGALLDPSMPLIIESFGNSLTNQMAGQATGNASARHFTDQGADPLWAYDVAFDDPLIIDVNFPLPVADADIVVAEASAAVMAVPDQISNWLKGQVDYPRKNKQAMRG